MGSSAGPVDVPGLWMGGPCLDADDAGIGPYYCSVTGPGCSWSKLEVVAGEGTSCDAEYVYY